MGVIAGFDSWADWGCPPTQLESNRSPRGVAVHYPGPGDFPTPAELVAAGVLDEREPLSFALPSSFSFSQHEQCRAIVRSWDSMHRSRGSRMLEYGAIICQHLVVIEGRNTRANPLTRVGSNGTYEANSSHLSVQLMRGADEGPGTQDELAAVGEWIRFLRSRGAGREITGHRDHYPTACPGDWLYRNLPIIGKYADDTMEDEDMPLSKEDIAAVRDAVRASLPGAVWNFTKTIDGVESQRAWWYLTQAQKRAASAALVGREVRAAVKDGVQAILGRELSKTELDGIQSRVEKAITDAVITVEIDAGGAEPTDG